MDNSIFLPVIYETTTYGEEPVSPCITYGEYKNSVHNRMSAQLLARISVQIELLRKELRKDK